MTRDSEDKYKQHLESALSKLASKNPNDSINEYIEALIEVARAFRTTKSIEEADKYFKEALRLFETNNQPSTIVCTLFWNYLAATDLEIFNNTFSRLFEATEKILKPYDSSQALALTINRLQYKHTSDTGEFEINCWKKAIEIRETIRGETHKSLSDLYDYYNNTCERYGLLEHAEQGIMRLERTARESNIKTLSMGYLTLADLYLQVNQFAKAEETWSKALTLEANAPSIGFKTKLAKLLQICLEKNRKRETTELTSIFFSNIEERTLEIIDKLLDHLICKCRATQNLTVELNLMEERLKASENCICDSAATSWRLRLSESYLNSGRSSESTQLFQQVLTSMALIGISTNKILSKRAQLLKSLGYTIEAASLSEASLETVAGPVKIRFGLFATQALHLGGNTIIQYFDPEPEIMSEIISSGKAYEVASCCLGTTYCQGNLKAAGLLYCNEVNPQWATRQIAIAPIPEDLKLLPPALEAPATGVNSLRSNDQLKPGDYTASFLQGRFCFYSQEKGTIRIFLTDDDRNTESYVFDVRPIFMDAAERRAYDLQLWYNGTKKVKLDGIIGLVYAPNAIVELPVNSNFSGAIVANRIIANGNNTITLDLSLTRRLFEN